MKKNYRLTLLLFVLLFSGGLARAADRPNIVPTSS